MKSGNGSRRLLMFAALVSLTGCSGLHMAARRGDLAQMRRILDRGHVDINARSHAEYSQTPLYDAVRRGRTEAVKLLIERGADLNARAQGYTPLCRAAIGGSEDIVRLLVDAGADIDVVCGGETALALAQSSGHTRIVQFLEKARAEAPLRAARRARLAREEVALAALSSTLPRIEAEERSGDEARQAGRSAEALEHYLTALRETPYGTDKDQELREKTIKTALAMRPAPAVPEEAKLHAERAQAFLKRAEGVEGYERAVSEFEKASVLAPWWAPVYFNLGLVREKARDIEGAVLNLKLYLLAAPGASDAEAVRKKLVDLEVALELEGSPGRTLEGAAPSKDREVHEPKGKR